MIQDKRINDLTKEQRQKLYLYLHKKVFNGDSQLITAQRRENIEDAIFHDVIMELLLKLLDYETDSEIEGDSDSDEENIVLSRTPPCSNPCSNKRVVNFGRDNYNIKEKMEMVDKVYQKKDKN